MLSIVPQPAQDPPSELEQLFQRWHGLVLHSALRITGSRADAEDVLQTLFVRLARRADLSELKRDPGAYFYRATVNASLDLLRSRDARGALEPIPSDRLVEGDPERHLTQGELGDALRQQLGALHPTAAEMFILRYVEDLDHRQIARLMETSVAVVAVTLFRARRQLKKGLADYQGVLS